MRFKVGEKVRFVVAIDDKLPPLIGKVGEIRAVGPFKPGTRLTVDGYSGTTQDGCDYVVRFDGAGQQPPKLIGPWDWQLQKLEPPVEPAAMRREQV